MPTLTFCSMARHAACAVDGPEVLTFHQAVAILLMSIGALPIGDGGPRIEGDGSDGGYVGTDFMQMDTLLTADERLVRDSTREFIDRELKPVI